MLSIEKKQRGDAWTNWSESYTAHPAYFAPTTIEEVQQIVRVHIANQRTIRVTGAGHSFSPVAMPEHSCMTLHHLRGLIHLDEEREEATFYGGTYLHEIGPLLAARGYALYNMGDIDTQSLAGVVATGTHGTGVTLTSFSNMVTKWGIVDGRGELRQIERADDAVSDALHLSLGLLGIFVTLTIRVRKLYRLYYKSERMALAHFYTNWASVVEANRHVEWYYFPGSETLQMKTMNEVAEGEMSAWQRKKERWVAEVVENKLLQVASEVCTKRPTWRHVISKMSAQLVPTGEKIDYSYHLFPTPRHVKFQETEYAIPLQQLPNCMRALHQFFQQHPSLTHFPIECRVAGGERGFLSPTQQQSVAYIAFHQYIKQHPGTYFSQIADIMAQFNGRAHWGKLNRYDCRNIGMLYDGRADFEEIRQQFDPQNIFLTRILRKILQ